MNLCYYVNIKNKLPQKMIREQFYSLLKDFKCLISIVRSMAAHTDTENTLQENKINVLNLELHILKIDIISFYFISFLY